MQSNGRPSVVILKSPNGRYEEHRANATTKPGEIIITDANGKVGPNGGAAATNILTMIATEQLQTLQGKTITDSYASDDLVSCWLPLNGDEMQLWLKQGQNVAKDAALETATAGQLQAISTGRLFARALEAVDATAAAKPINVRIVL